MDFKSVATKMKDDIEKPPLPPVGNYQFQINKPATVETTKDGKWDIVNYPVQAVGVISDVDEEALQVFGGAKKVRLRVGFIFDKEDEAAFKQTEYYHKVFLTEHVQCWDDGMSLAQAMSAAVNKQFGGSVGLQQDKKNEDVFRAQIAKTFPLEA